LSEVTIGVIVRFGETLVIKVFAGFPFDVVATALVKVPFALFDMTRAGNVKLDIADTETEVIEPGN